MEKDNNKDLWEEICFDLCAVISDTISEEVYEQTIIMALEKMGWKRFKGEIILKKNIPIGSAQSIKPDIIIESKEKGMAFVIEVKKPSISLSDDRYRGQLFSYMRQLKYDFGILFGEKIQIFYDGNLNQSSNPIQIKTIEFSSNDSPDDFIRLFQKESFTRENLSDYAKCRIGIMNSKNKKEELKALVLSSSFNAALVEMMKNYLRENWDDRIIEAVLKDLHITMQEKRETVRTNHIHTELHATRTSGSNHGKVEYFFDPPNEKEFKRQLLQRKSAYIKIIYKDGREEEKSWGANRFTENSNLRGNINSKTWFRQEYVQRHGVVKAYFSISPF
jgi:hypothetical protein